MEQQQTIERLKKLIEASIQMANECPHERPRQKAIEKLSELSEQLWDMAASDSSLFAQVKELDTLIEPFRSKSPTRKATGPRVKQPAADAVRKIISELQWDGTSRLHDDGFWKLVFGSVAVARKGNIVATPTGRVVKFIESAIKRLYKPGRACDPLILVGDGTEDLGRRLSPAVLPPPYRTSVGHLVLSRASLITLFDGIGNSMGQGPFSDADKDDDGKTDPRWFSSVCFVKRSTIIAETAGYILCQGDAPGVPDIAQVWAEAYYAIHSSSKA